MSVPERPAWLRGELPLIGMVHLLPLPGSPRWKGSMQAVCDRAREDAETLVREGIRTLLIENFGDSPFHPGEVPAETTAAMAAVLGRLRPEMDPSLSWGVNILRNDGRSAVAVAAATEAGFIRVNVHSGSAWTDQGLIQGRAWETARLRAVLAPGLAILADVNVKHAQPVAQARIGDCVRDLIERGLADALLVTGSRTGAAPDMDELDAVVNAASGIPVMAASGVCAATVRGCLERCHGAIIGTSVKRDGRTDGPVDMEMVRRLMDSARLRGSDAEPGGSGI